MTCIVIDDEPLARKGLQMLIEQIPHLKLLGEFSNVVDADDFLKNNVVDILFLDIHMPRMNGMEFLKSTQPDCKVIITTAYPQFAVEAFELDVTDYLVKPIRFERFYKAIHKTQQAKNGSAAKISPEEDYIFIRSERKYIRSNFSEIEYIEGLKDYVIIHCGADKHIVATNLKTIQTSLPAHLFVRISKSFIINVSKIKSIDHEWVLLNSQKLPIGDNFKNVVLDFIHNKKILKR